jgi:hypothetical protein
MEKALFKQPRQEAEGDGPEHGRARSRREVRRANTLQKLDNYKSSG